MLLFERHIFFLTVNLQYNITPSCSLCLQDGGKQKLEKAKITLNDCLACSGCITSAESVLITQQSHEEIYGVLRNNKVVCVCVCCHPSEDPQTGPTSHTQPSVFRDDDGVCICLPCV